MSDTVTLISLTVTTGGSAEIFLMDSRLELIAQGIGRLETRQPPGVYKLKVRQGREMQERVVLLEKDTQLTIDAPEFSTAVPILNTQRSHEYHFNVAQQYSKHVTGTLGPGSPDTSIFVLARYWTGPYAGVDSARSFPPPAEGLSLRRFDDKDHIDLGRTCRLGTGPEWDPSAACTIGVEPGPYVLRSRMRTGVVIEQVIPAFRGWQTQVFVLRQPLMEERFSQLTPKNPDDMSNDELFTLSVMMGKGSFRDDGQLRLTELARIALADERPLLSDELTLVLRGKHDNPMLGIFGAHLLLLSKARADQEAENLTRRSGRIPRQRPAYTNVFDQSLFDDVIANLRRMIGNTDPDVEALSLRSMAPGARTQMVFETPPMLRRSWSLLVEASMEQPALLPMETWRRVAQMTATRPFLSWILSKTHGALDRKLTGVLRERLDAARRPESPRPGARSARAFEPGSAKGAAAELSPELRKRLSVDLEIPASAVDWLIHSQVLPKKSIR